MAKLLIERSNTRRFSAEELRGKVRESRAFWNSPEGKRREAQLEIERRNRKSTPPRFPGLIGTKPSIIGPDETLIVHTL